MGTDIHWVIERRHADGFWVAVASKTEFYDQAFEHGPGQIDWTTIAALPAYRLGERDYLRFGLLSGVRIHSAEESGIFACREGLPEDISPSGHQVLDESDGDLHSRGWATLREIEAFDPITAWLKSTAEEEGTPVAEAEEQAIATMATWIAALRATISGDRRFPLTVLGLLERDEDSQEYPRPTAHQLISAEYQLAALEPIGPETVRVLIAYDN